MRNKYFKNSLKFSLKKTLLPLFLTSLLGSFSASFAKNITIPDDDPQVNVSVNIQSGSLLQLPSPVASVTAALHYRLTPVGGGFDPKSGLTSDVSQFQVSALGKRFQSEKVTFVFADKRSLDVYLSPSRFGEKYYNLISKNYAKPHNPDGNSLRFDTTNFLSTETKLMKAMLSDEDRSFQRTLTNKEVELLPYGHSLQVKLVRIFEGANLFGYTFVFKNTTEKTIHIEPQNLAIGNPNRAIMAQSDRYTLKPCSQSKIECVTAVRYVVRNFEASDSTGFDRDRPFSGGMPYVMPSKK